MSDTEEEACYNAAIQNGKRSEKKRSIKPRKISSSKIGVSIAKPRSNNI